MERWTPNFTDILNPFELTTLEEFPQSVHALSKDLELIYFNPAWADFYSRNNQGKALPPSVSPGVPILDFIQGVEKEHYRELYRKVLDSNKVMRHEYECHTPNLFRLCEQMLYPLKDRKGILVVNNLKLLKEMPNSKGASSYRIEAKFLNGDGYYYQCSNCRKTQRKDGSGWDHVPTLIREMPSNVSHTICQVCFEYYWEGAADK